jgi:hypothetical protein
MAETTRHDDDSDHDVWVRCFTAVLTGAIATGSTIAEANNPEKLAQRCALFADAALTEERQRRRQPSP